MKILVIGAKGTLGKAIVSRLKKRHTVIEAGLSNGSFQVDISNEESIRSMYEAVGPIDGVACAAGRVAFAPFSELTTEELNLGLQNKLLGQVQLVKIGSEFISKNGSFTLISGILNEDPIYKGTSAAMINGALNSFVSAVSDELREFRINIVSPTIVEESVEKYDGFFRGFKPTTAAEVALAYEKSIEGIQSGKIIRVGY